MLYAICIKAPQQPINKEQPQTLKFVKKKHSFIYEWYTSHINKNGILISFSFILIFFIVSVSQIPTKKIGFVCRSVSCQFNNLKVYLECLDLMSNVTKLPRKCTIMTLPANLACWSIFQDVLAPITFFQTRNRVHTSAGISKIWSIISFRNK